MKKNRCYWGHGQSIYAITIQPPYHFFTAGGDGFVAGWDLRSADSYAIMRAANPIYSLYYFTNALWVGHHDGTIRVINLKDTSLLTEMRPVTEPIFDFVAHPQWPFVIAAAGNGSLYVYDNSGFKLEAQIKVSPLRLRTAVLSPNGQWLVVAGGDKTLYWFAVGDWQRPAIIVENAHEDTIFSLAFSPEGDILLSGGKDAYLKVWDTNHPQTKLAEVVGHHFTINHVVFSEDGQYLATASADKTIKLWKGDTLKLLKVLDKSRNDGHTASVNRLAWLDKTLLSVSDDRQIIGWQV